MNLAVLVHVNYHSFGHAHGAWPVGDMNGDKEISVFEVTVMIKPPDWMLHFLVMLSRSQASSTSREGPSNKVRTVSTVSMWLRGKVANLEKDSTVWGLEFLCR